MNGIEIKNIQKSFGSIQALQNINLELPAGRIYGLLGRNGAGKSTLLNIITNRIFSDYGHVLVDGRTAAENDSVQQKIYMMSEKNLYPDSLRVRDVFRCTEAFYGSFDQKRALQFCEQFGLDPQKKLRSLSLGYSSIYKIITALCVDVPYILLDEPILGLDAHHRELFYQSLLSLYAKTPRTYILSTHLIEEVSGVIEDVVILAKGRLILHQPCEELLSTGYTVSGPADAIDRLIADRQVIGSDTLGGLKTAYILGRPEDLALPENIELSKLDLQKLFIQLTNV